MALLDDNENITIIPTRDFNTREWLKNVQRFMTKVDSEGVENAIRICGLEVTEIDLPQTPAFRQDREFQQSVIELANALDQFQFNETVLLDKYIGDFAEPQEN
jgi:hypothetical protein